MVVYDSVFGNTEQVARAIARAMGGSEDIQAHRVAEVSPEQLMALETLVVGSPTRGFQPTPATKRLLDRIPRRGLEGLKVAAFDTRFAVENVDSAILKVMVKLFGYAAKPIADRLMKKGGDLMLPPEGFFVEDTEGPLREGELDRAADWAARVAATR
jgi:flavodoxin